MPDPILMSKAFAVAMVFAMTTALVFGRSPRAAIASAGAVLAIAIATFIGLWTLGLLPHVPPHDVLDRLVVVVLPAVALAELVAALSTRLGWLMRGGIAILTMPVLLRGSAYTTDLSGPGSREWSLLKAIVICASCGLVVIAVWAAMIRLAVRTQSRTPLWVVVCALLAVGAVVMLSGYATGGQIAVPFAASLFGVGLSSLVGKYDLRTENALGIGIVGLFALLVVGRLFAGVTDLNAVLLLVAPLFAWLPEFVPTRPRVRSALRLAVPAIPAAVALILAQQKFATDSRDPMYGAAELPGRIATESLPDGSFRG